VLFYGQGGAFLVGPSDERWDAVMLVRQSKRCIISCVCIKPSLPGGNRASRCSTGRFTPAPDGAGTSLNLDAAGAGAGADVPTSVRFGSIFPV